MHGFPVSNSASRTALTSSAGARSQAYSRRLPRGRTIPGLLVYRYNSPLFFANADNFHRRALAAVDALRLELTGRGIVFALARVKQDLREDLDAYGLTESVGADVIFPTGILFMKAGLDACRNLRYLSTPTWSVAVVEHNPSARRRRYSNRGSD